LRFLVSRSHPLAERTAVTADEIAAAGLVTTPLYGSETGIYREVLRDFGLTGDHTVLEVEGQQARLLATASGIGVMATFIPGDADETAFGELVPLSVEGELPTVEVGLVRRPGDPWSSSTDALAGWLRKLAHR
jgi:DNA-binding transcriptional LysR family regulator